MNPTPKRAASWREAQSRASLRRWERHVSIAQDVRETLDGLVASDAHMHSHPTSEQASLTITSRFESFARHIAEMLAATGISTSVVPVIAGLRRATYWKASTLSYVELGAIWRRWYPGGKKRLAPFDISPLALLYWYLGDGSLGHRKSRHSVSTSIRLATYGFDAADVDKAAERIGIAIGAPDAARVYRGKDGPTISILNAGTRPFLDFIGQSPVSEFAYKWNLAGPGE